MGVRSKKFIRMLAAMQRVELYSLAHPGSPAAVRRPQLCVRGKVWTAVLGANLTENITGFGPTVEAALKDFDAKYLLALRPQETAAIEQIA